MKEFSAKRAYFSNFLKSETGMSRQAILLILLVIVAGAGYAFCFTDLLKPGDKAETSTANGTLVKKPMPPRPTTDVARNGGKSAIEKKKFDVTAKNEAGAEKSAPLKPSGGKSTSAPKQSGPKPGPVKAESAKPGKEHVVQTTPAKSQVNTKAVSKADPARKPNKTTKNAENADQDETPTKSLSKSSDGGYTLLVGVYVMEKSMREAKGKLKSAGLLPVVSKGPKKEEPMNRLFMGEFESYPEASVELNKIRKITHDAFILPENGKYIVYAGSYFVEKSAVKQRDRLIDAGFKPTVRKTKAPVSTYRLTAGNFQGTKPAQSEAERLKKLGLNVLVVKSGS